MSLKLPRPIAPDLHPIATGNYRIATPAIQGFCRIIYQTAEFFRHGASPLNKDGPCPPAHKIGRRTTSHRFR